MNGDEEKTFTTILLAIKGEVGETKGKVSGMCDDLATIKGKMDQVVTRTECTGKHAATEASLSKAVDGVRDDLRRGLADIKKGSRVDHQAITPEMLATAAAAPPHVMTPVEMEAILGERAEVRAEHKRKLVTWYLGTGAALLGVLGTFGGFVYKTVLTLDKVQNAVASQPSELRREIQQATTAAANRPQKVVYVQAPGVKNGTDEDGKPLPAPAPRRPAPKRAAPKR